MRGLGEDQTVSCPAKLRVGQALPITVGCGRARRTAALRLKAKAILALLDSVSMALVASKFFIVATSNLCSDTLPAFALSFCITAKVSTD